MVKIYKSDRSSTQYKFSLNSQYYNNAYRIYKEKLKQENRKQLINNCLRFF